MKKWISLDKVATADGGTLELWQHDADYVIRFNGKELMSTRLHTSEDALATLACEPFSQKKDVRVLIGGMGFGFTLRAALGVLARDAQVVVAELNPAVVEWNRTHLAEVSGKSLKDSRVSIAEGDVVAYIAAQDESFDVILLDVDNGPCEMTAVGNDRLYSDKGIAKIKKALRSDGYLGVWSVQDDPAYLRRLRRAGFDAKSVSVPAHGKSGKGHVLFLGRLMALKAKEP